MQYQNANNSWPTTQRLTEQATQEPACYVDHANCIDLGMQARGTLTPPQ